MTDEPDPESVGAAKRSSRSPWAQFRRRMKRLRRSRTLARYAGTLAHGALWLVHRTQRPHRGSSPFADILEREHPAIVGLWHGQHLLAPFFRPRHLPYVALLSRNRDAEVNAAVVERFGIETIRGSGGRVRSATAAKGGVGALLALLRALANGKGVCMIADVPKGEARQAGMGIVTLARLSGRPIIPAAAVTSRRHVLARTWDRTTLPLPLGRLAVVLGEPIFVPRDLSPAEIESKRREVTDAIEAANSRALSLADGLESDGARR